MIIVLYCEKGDSAATHLFVRDLLSTLGDLTFDLDVDPSQLATLHYRYARDAMAGGLCLISLREGVMPGTSEFAFCKGVTKEWRELLTVQYVRVYSADYPA